VALLALAAAEIALRLAYDRIEALTGVTAWETGRYEDLTYHWDRYDPTLGWTNLPGYESDERVPFRVRINAQGLRGERDTAPAAAPGVTRIAVLGDSTTFGEEVDDAHTVPAHVEAALPGTEVLNFGVHGYGAGQMMLLLEARVFDFEPDVVVVVYLALDIFRDTEAAFVHAKPVFALEEGRVAVRNVPVPERSRQPFLQRHSFVAAWLWGRPRALPAATGIEEHAALLSAIVARMQEACAARGVPLAVVHLIDRNTLEAARRDPAIRAAVDAMRAVVLEAGGEHALDLTAFLADAHDGDPAGLTKPHGHWSERANRLIAERIAAHLREHHLVPPRDE
jgi:hypothetical protein